MLPSTLTREQVRRVDRVAIERYGIPGVVLMENAGLRAAERIADALAPSSGPVAIACGGEERSPGAGMVESVEPVGRPVVVGEEEAAGTVDSQPEFRPVSPGDGASSGGAGRGS